RDGALAAGASCGLFDISLCRFSLFCGGHAQTSLLADCQAGYSGADRGWHVWFPRAGPWNGKRVWLGIGLWKIRIALARNIRLGRFLDRLLRFWRIGRRLFRAFRVRPGRLVVFEKGHELS